MTFETKIKSFVAVLGLAGFLFGVFEFLRVQAVEAEKPYLEKKLAWCEEAVETTAKIATSVEPSQVDISRFWEMYWGVMGLIEKETITSAMVGFGEALIALEKSNLVEPSPEGPKDVTIHLTSLKGKSLKLAHACRRELSSEWSTSWSR